MEVPAVVTEYDPRWPGVFERLRDRLDAALAGVAHVTEHVGSTAVGGLAAKPIIDVDVVVTDEMSRQGHACTSQQRRVRPGPRA